MIKGILSLFALALVSGCSPCGPHIGSCGDPNKVLLTLADDHDTPVRMG